MTAAQALDETAPQYSSRQFYWALGVVLTTALLWWTGLPVTFGYDKQEQQCLPDLHLAMLVHYRPSPASIHGGDMVFFKSSDDILAYNKQDFVMKLVAGVPGDHLSIRNGEVRINGSVVVSGFPLAERFYNRKPETFEKDEIIPDGKFFLIGTHPLSEDSRYWGYLDGGRVMGKGYKVY